jgi:hypothetical protein
MMIISSSSSSPSVLGSSFERGLNSCHPTTSVDGWSSNKSSLGISRGRTCALEIRRTSRAANRSLASPYRTTSADSASNAILSVTLSTQTSSARSSLGPCVVFYWLPTEGYTRGGKFRLGDAEIRNSKVQGTQGLDRFGPRCA